MVSLEIGNGVQRDQVWAFVKKTYPFFGIAEAGQEILGDETVPEGSFIQPQLLSKSQFRKFILRQAGAQYLFYSCGFCLCPGVRSEERRVGKECRCPM